MPLQQMANAQHRRLVRQSHDALADLGKLAEHWRVVQRLFHRRIRQAEPLLQVASAQHRLHRERPAASLRTRAVWLDDLHQRGPRHHTFHLVQELRLVGLLRRQVQAKTKLLHAGSKSFAEPTGYAAVMTGFGILGSASRRTTHSPKAMLISHMPTTTMSEASPRGGFPVNR